MTDTIEPVLAAAAAAAPLYAATTPTQRARFLTAVADAVEEAGPEIIALGVEETGLAEARMAGELKRTCWQLRLFAEVVIEGAYLDVRIDEADPDFVIGPRPDLRRVNVPVGPVLVFAASNFPLAFSVAGGDTASALAAGCPVIVKTHSGHPRLSARTAAAVSAAVAAQGLPAGVFATISGQRNGVAALEDDRVRAAGFTGSTEIGTMLAGIAAGRPRPIPFFGELGSVNPVVITAQALAERAQDVLTGYVASVAGSAGQLCTKPGFVFVPAGAELGTVIQDAAAGLGEHRLLTPGSSRGYVERQAAVVEADGTQVIANGGFRTDDAGYVWARPAVVETTLAALTDGGNDLVGEVFGPFSVIVRYDSLDEVAAAWPTLFPGNLTSTLHLADSDRDRVQPLVAAMAATSGRVLFNGWPTGVSVTPAMQHGGPFPATTTDSTSVGTAAIGRFLRGVCFQNVPPSLLPQAVRDDNPWNVPQRRSPAGLSGSWGTLTGRY